MHPQVKQMICLSSWAATTATPDKMHATGAISTITPGAVSYMLQAVTAQPLALLPGICFQAPCRVISLVGLTPVPVEAAEASLAVLDALESTLRLMQSLAAAAQDVFKQSCSLRLVRSLVQGCVLNAMHTRIVVILVES